VTRLTTEMYLSDMVPAMKPSDDFAKTAHRKTELVSIEKLEGCITAILLAPHTPGIPLLVPGERFNETVADYLRFARDFNARFPGSETDVHGLVKREVNGKMS
jgi:arginine decarboxylase